MVYESEVSARDRATPAHELACGRSQRGSAHGISEPGPCPDVGISRHESVRKEPHGADCDRRPASSVSDEALHSVADECGTGISDAATRDSAVPPDQGACYAIVEYVPGDLITRDLPGMQDAVWHMCERFGIVTNDKWFQHLIWITRAMDRADPRLCLRIVPGSWALEWAIRDLSGSVTLTSDLPYR